MGKQTSVVAIFVVMCIIPLGSYFFLHRNLALRHSRLERAMVAEMKEVTKLKKEVAELTRIKDSLALSTSALRTALRSFGRPLPAGLVTGDGEEHLPSAEGGIPALGSVGTTPELHPGQQGYIFVPPSRTIQDCSPHESSTPEDHRPLAWTRFFKNRKAPGFFVEVGAGDGTYKSPTYFLERSLCWTGILIEPTNNEFPRLLSQRPRSVAVHGAACQSDSADLGPFTDITLNGVWAGWSGFASQFSNSHTAAIKMKESSGNDGSKWAATEIPVTCFAVKTLLQRQSVNHVDYMYISVQGAELRVLQGMDFKDVTVDVIDIDISNSLPEVKELLEANGFTLHSTHDIRGNMFVRKAFFSGAIDVSRLY